MGPLLPYEIISSDWQPVIYLILGLAFGIVLEQAGFSSSKKLVGIFYGYDFVVLKVFFTAAITAMFGLIFLQYFGLIDMDLVNINSNFLYSAIAGGVIMGFGFIIGGFCPGTSVTAAAIGKIDAMIFIVGIFLGVIVFGYLEPVFKPLLEGGYYFDREMVTDSLGLSRGWFVVILTVVALVGFAVGHYFENRAGAEWKPTNTVYSGYAVEISLALMLAFVVLYLPVEKANSFNETDEVALIEHISNPKNVVTSDELAYFMKHKYQKYRVVDVRSVEDFAAFSLPTSVNVPYNQILDRKWKELLDSPLEKVVLVSNGGVEAGKALMVCKRAGYRNVYVLDGGINKFVQDIFHTKVPEVMPWKEREADQIRFRIEMARYFKNEKTEQPTRPASVETKKVKTGASGGC
jgi:rhodanese-related sulfurtransferase